ncbi:MAG: hypothetical protein V2A73_16420 [Pseudomonadota bacterium]
MLQASHEGKKYAKPMLVPKLGRSRSFEDVYQALGSSHEPQQASGDQRRDLGDSGEISLDELARRYLDTRDQLAYRQLRGETLTPRERIMLSALNRIVERLLPPPAPLPRRVSELVDELLRRR